MLEIALGIGVGLGIGVTGTLYVQHLHRTIERQRRKIRKAEVLGSFTTHELRRAKLRLQQQEEQLWKYRRMQMIPQHQLPPSLPPLPAGMDPRMPLEVEHFVATTPVSEQHIPVTPLFLRVLAEMQSKQHVRTTSEQVPEVVRDVEILSPWRDLDSVLFEVGHEVEASAEYKDFVLPPKMYAMHASHDETLNFGKRDPFIKDVLTYVPDYLEDPELVFLWFDAPGVMMVVSQDMGYLLCSPKVADNRTIGSYYNPPAIHICALMGAKLELAQTPEGQQQLLEQLLDVSISVSYELDKVALAEVADVQIGIRV